MTIDFYYLPGSAPCRAVLMTAKALGLEMNLKLTNLMAGEHMTPEFLKLNPQHTIPTLVDNGFALWESRAIQCYLVEKYGKTDSLFPKDAHRRAIVNQRLYFDMGQLYQAFAEYWYPQLFAKQPADPEKFKKMENAMDILNKLLIGNEYAVGNNLTIADMALLATISTYEATGFDFSKYPNVAKWFDKCKATTPGYNINQAGIDDFKKFLGK